MCFGLDASRIALEGEFQESGRDSKADFELLRGAHGKEE
jgi:hypothetical protein